MSSFMSEHIISPVLRQARRLSDVSRIASFTSPGDQPPGRDLDAVTDSEMSDHASAYTAGIPPDPLTSTPYTSSTQETRVEEAMSNPALPETMSNSALPETISNPEIPVTVSDHELPTTMSNPGLSETVQSPTHDHLGFPLTPPKRIHLPEDDGMRALRAKIQAINAQNVSQEEKGRLMHELLLENYNTSRIASHIGTSPRTAASLLSQSPNSQMVQGPSDTLKFVQNASEELPPSSFSLSDADKSPTYAPIRRPKDSGVNTPNDEPVDDQPPLGCQHYERNVKSQCFTCEKWYTCRMCHDAQEDHQFPFHETRYMLCMLCTTPQKVSDVCVNCGETAAQYYCSICKLWENRQSKPIYHCNDCGICRRGLGLGKDYVHCKTCCACIPAAIETSHKCIERSTDCDCPICGDYMFTSPKIVVFMRCGHSIHKRCYEKHMQVSYKCPICNKSLINMETQFRNMDVAILGQPMPPEFRDTKALILCNDCSGRSTVPFHWLGLKCSICLSYNTAELHLSGGDSGLNAALAERAAPTTDPIPSAPPVDTRPSVPASTRRRHSSRAIDIPRPAPPPSEPVAGSYPPVSMRQDISDNESDDGMLGLWGNGGGPSALDYYYSDYSDMSEDLWGEDEDEDEDEADFRLIGHR